MADPSQIPPPSGAGPFLPWILGGIGTALGVLWAAVQSGRAKQIATLEAALEHEQDERKREREEARQALERLGARLDEAERQRTTLAIRYAGAVSRVRADPQIPNEFADEAPTGVRALADLMAPKTARTASDPHGLRGFDPYEKTPK